MSEEPRKEILLLKSGKKIPSIFKNLKHLRSQCKIGDSQARKSLYEDPDEIERILSKKDVNLMIQHVEIKIKRKILNENSQNEVQNAADSLVQNSSSVVRSEVPVIIEFERTSKAGLHNSDSADEQEQSRDSNITTDCVNSSNSCAQYETVRDLLKTDPLEQNSTANENLSLQKRMNSGTRSHDVCDKYNLLVMARVFDNNILERVEFEIVDFEAIEDLQNKTNVVFEHCPYFCTFVGIYDERMFNLLTDIFAPKSNSVCLDNIEHYLCIEEIQSDDLLTTKRNVHLYGSNGLAITNLGRKSQKKESKPTPSANTVNTTGPNASKDSFDEPKHVLDISLRKIQTHEIVGPHLTLRVSKKWYCDDKTFRTSLPKKQSKIKNLHENVVKDKIGTLHIERQDLSEIKLKKRQKFRKNAEVLQEKPA